MADEHAAFDAGQPFRLEQRIGVGHDVADAEAAIELVERRRAIRARDRELERRQVVGTPGQRRARAEEVLRARRLPVIAARADDEREIGARARSARARRPTRSALRDPGIEVGNVTAPPTAIRVSSMSAVVWRASAPTSTSAAFQVRIHWPPAVTKLPGTVCSLVQPFGLAIGRDDRERLEVVLTAAGDARGPEAAGERAG